MKQFVLFLGMFSVPQRRSARNNRSLLLFVSDNCAMVSINDNFRQIVYFSETWAFYNLSGLV